MIKSFIQYLDSSLTKPIFETSYFYIDYWSFIHFFSGILIMFLLLKTKLKAEKKFLALFFILVTYEIFEMNFSWIQKENPLDLVYDLIIGTIGGSIVFYKFERKLKSKF